MSLDEIKIRRLAGQYLLAPADTQTVVKDLCGLQAQFLGHALHGLSIRTGIVNTDGLVKSWTNRGTMHLFSVDDLPLFLHEGRRHHLRPVDTLQSDAYIDADKLNMYQITEDGEVMLLPMRGGLPSDSNYLNLSLAQTNDMFNDLLDVEEM